ncbi:DUF4011 domain-containing protein [Microvenator marinus]|uniref:DUF4011 domain-containing protein n=1 Tax=Microvenator marinus TaxID=2600177 RepID=UPI00201B8085|nr:DUF4011 domain-containing protein [Microvenator marinus]
MSQQVVISLELDAHVQLATLSMRRQILRSLVITNHGSEALENLSLELECDPELIHAKTIRIERIDASEVYLVPDAQLRLAMKVERLANLTESQDGTFIVRLKSGAQTLAEFQQALTFEACNEWLGARLPPESLAAFVTPNHPSLNSFLNAMREELRAAGVRDSLEGYQARSPQRVLELASAAYNAVNRLGIGYSNPPASFHLAGQKIRTIDQILESKLGTCLDLSVLLAAALEQCGLHPFIVLVEGHAFPGVWLTEWNLPTPWNEDPLPVKKRVLLGECAVFESTGAPDRLAFTKATKLAEARLEDIRRYHLAVDIKACRNAGITPLGLLRSNAFKTIQDTRVESADVPQALAPLPVVQETPRARIDRWKSKLLDLTLRNRLINHRDSKSVLPVLGSAMALMEDELQSRGKLELVPRQDLHAVEDLNEHTQAMAKQGRLVVDLSKSDFEKRCVEIYRSNAAMIQDGGVSALFLAIGFVRWFESETSELSRLAPILLVPLVMERTKVGGPYRIARSDDDVIWNASIFQKLEAEFGIKTEVFGPSPPEDQSGVDVDASLRLVLNAIKDLERFEVVWNASVALYQFQKFMMWSDLEQNSDALMSSEVVRHIVEGSEEPFPIVGTLPSADTIDQLPATDDLSVVDSDSSQLAAIRAALSGNSFVLQGPPGTGKSQTITNLIAQALANNKTVLFVSEKRAALEVVESRLKSVGLGPFTLEVHSDKSSKAEVVKQLEEPLKFAWPESSDQWTAHANKLGVARDKLNSHAQRFHAPGPFGESLYATVARLIALDARNTPRISLQFGGVPDQSTYEKQKDAVAEFAARTKRLGDPSANAWRYVTHTDWGISWSQEVRQQLEDTISKGQDWSEKLDATVETLVPNGEMPPEAFEHLGQIAFLLSSCPGVPKELLTGNRDQIEQLVQRVEKDLEDLKTVREQIGQSFDLAIIDDAQLAETRARFQRWSQAFFLLAFFMLFFARGHLKSFAHNANLPDNKRISDDLGKALNARERRARLRDVDSQITQLFGVHWASESTPLNRLRDVWEWAKKYRATLVVIREADERVGDRLAEIATDTERLGPETKLGGLLRSLKAADEAWQEAKRELSSLLKLNDQWAVLDGYRQLNLARSWAVELESLQTWCDWLRSGQVVQSLGLERLFEHASKGELLHEDILPSYERSLREHYWNARCESDPDLKQFRGHDHERVIEQFRVLDDEAKSVARSEVQARLAARLPERNAPGEMEVLRKEFSKQRAHKPIRKLFAEVPHVLLRLKPCVLMSPLSVARFLSVSDQLFDIVVFDEASQIPPWDAIGAIARGKQAIIVGDSKQLPPTSFFSSNDSDEFAEDEDFLELESILEQAVVRGVPQLTLNWHYRSRHESLIAFSNFNYYDNRLHVFPSPHHRSAHLGLKWVQVKDGVYDRGGSRTNRREGEEVVSAILARLKDPELQQKSIGVVTFSSAQQRLILDLLDEARRAHPEIEDFFTDAVPEPIFVKNLENVQGDERDVMFFSICYGPDAAGKMTLSFGPLNKVGGERRLNVAVTRARELLVVFSTFHPDQIDVGVTNPSVRQLKLFLDYAARGKSALIGAAMPDESRGFGSPFEEEVYEALRERGWDVHTQVGVGGFYIDLAVVDPARPGVYLLGIECDGAAYHSAKSARDRDRIRQNILENLGWRIHRIWSTDWWTQRTSQLQRVLGALDEARLESEKQAIKREAFSLPLRNKADEQVLPPQKDEAPTDEPAGWPSDVSPWLDLPEISGGEQEAFYSLASRQQIGRQIQALVQSRAPIKLNLIARHITQAWGFSSTSAKARDLVLELAQVSQLHVKGDVLWVSKEQANKWKGFRHHDIASRNITDVPEAEVAGAMLWIVERAISIQEKDLFSEVAAAFGFKSLGRQIRETCAAVLAMQVAEGKLKSDDGKVSFAPGYSAK